MAKTNQLGALAAAAGATLVAVGLLVLMLVVEAQPAGATFPGKPGKIAYAGFEGTPAAGDIPAPGDYEIYTIKPGGGGRVQLTDNGTNDGEPFYSPSGKKIAYAGFEGTQATGDYEIYTIKPGGGGKFNVTDNTTDDREPSYSPSGKKIAYEGRDGSQADDNEIYTIKPSGGGRVQLTDNGTNDFGPSWGRS